MAKLRQGRRVPEHVYLQLGPVPADIDKPLFTVPNADLANIIVSATNHGIASSYSHQIAFDRAADEVVTLG